MNKSYGQQTDAKKDTGGQNVHYKYIYNNKHIKIAIIINFKI